MTKLNGNADTLRNASWFMNFDPVPPLLNGGKPSAPISMGLRFYISLLIVVFVMPIAKESTMSKYTEADRRKAQQLFRYHKARGTLRAPRGLGAVAFGSGGGYSVRAAATVWQDYLPEARRSLSAR